MKSCKCKSFVRNKTQTGLFFVKLEVIYPMNVVGKQNF